MKRVKLDLCSLLFLLLTSFNMAWAQEGVFNNIGDFALASSATYEAQLKDLTGAGTGHDHINITGNLSLNGTLDLVLNGYSPNANDQFEVIAYTGILSGTFTTINWPAAMADQGWAIDYGVLNPGKVTIYGPSSMVLPVELITFTGTASDNQVLLNWQTASEVNNAGFQLQRSADASSWNNLTFVTGKGTTQVEQSYSYPDGRPLPGLNYYRLQQIDFDGAFEFSKIIAVNITGADQVELFVSPNPTNADFTFSIRNPGMERMRVQLNNHIGHQIWESDLISETTFWKKDFHIKTQGIYIMTVQVGAQILQKRIMVVGMK